MRISDVVKRKGDTVITVRSDASVTALLDLLAEHRIGAVVVSDDGHSVAGIVSERDIVRHLQKDGAQVLDQPVSSIMTREVQTCSPDDQLDELMSLMSKRRIRHVPVCEDDQLVGIVSIGDVVKHKIDALQFERDQLDSYVHQS